MPERFYWSLLAQANVRRGRAILATDMTSSRRTCCGAPAPPRGSNPMRKHENDRWQADFVPRARRHVFTVEAWWDEWGTLCRNLQTMHAAGLDIAPQIDECTTLLRHLAERSTDGARIAIGTALQRLAQAAAAGQLELLLSDEMREFVASTGHRPFLTRLLPRREVLDAGLPQATSASWYELVPAVRHQ